MKPVAPGLALFDIDGTLLRCQGLGKAALLRAMHECCSADFDETHPIAGKTDRQFVRECLSPYLEEERLKALLPAIFSRYVELLQEALYSSSAPYLLPGVLPLLEGLRRTPNWTIGLLTGNIRRGAEIKLGRFGILDLFSVGAYGDDGDVRRELPPLARSRAETHTGQSFAASRIFILGDTPNDIDCGRPIGARCIAVATGGSSSQELAAHQPWRLFESFADHEAVLQVLLADD